MYDDKGNRVNEVEAVKIRFKSFLSKIFTRDSIILMDVVETKPSITSRFCVKIVKIRWKIFKDKAFLFVTRSVNFKNVSLPTCWIFTGVEM